MCLSSTRLIFYDLQTRLGIIVNMLTLLKCSVLDYCFFFYYVSLTRYGVSTVTVIFALVVSVCCKKDWELQVL